jgi:hypothetical protein
MVAADEASSRDRKVLGNSDPDPTLKLPGVKLMAVDASGANGLGQHRHKTPPHASHNHLHTGIRLTRRVLESIAFANIQQKTSYPAQHHSSTSATI